MMSAGRFVVDDRLALLAGVQALHQFQGDVLAGAQDAQALLGSFAHLGGIRTKEERRDGQDTVAPDAVVQRYVVSFHPASPTASTSLAGLPKMVQAYHSVSRRNVTRPASCSSGPSTSSCSMINWACRLESSVRPVGHQRVGQSPLLLGHVPQHQAHAGSAAGNTRRSARRRGNCTLIAAFCVRVQAVQQGQRRRPRISAMPPAGACGDDHGYVQWSCG